MMQKKAAHDAERKAYQRDRAMRYLAKKTASAIVLQTRYRAFATRKRWLNTIAEKLNRAARAIQAAWYVFRLRKVRIKANQIINS